MGNYNPMSNQAELFINKEKAQDSLSKGVQPTETLRAFLVKEGIMEAPKKQSAPRTKVRKKK